MTLLAYPPSSHCFFEIFKAGQRPHEHHWKHWPIAEWLIAANGIVLGYGCCCCFKWWRQRRARAAAMFVDVARGQADAASTAPRFLDLGASGHCVVTSLSFTRA